MAKKTSETSEILDGALIRFDAAQGAAQGVREQCLEDRRFITIAGAQWEGAFSEQFESKPKLEVDKVHLSVMRIINEYRNNRITVDFVAKDGSERDDLAELCDGLFRADVERSGSDEAFDNGFEEAVSGGFGAWRLTTEYEDEEDDENDQQQIAIVPIYDADTSVYFDPNAKRQDKSDADYCFVITAKTLPAYEAEYGDDPASWNKSVSGVEFDWYTPDIVYVAEYYTVDMVQRTVEVWADNIGKESRHSDLSDEIRTEMLAKGSVKVGEKKVKTRKITKYVLSGSRVLEGPTEIAGKMIPIIPVYGKRWFVDNVERCMGQVRLAKDPQRLKNMQVSRIAEISALSPVRKPIFVPEQVAGLEARWSDDNVKNYPYQLVNPITDAAGNPLPSGPVAYTEPPDIPQATAMLMQTSDADLRDVLGNQEAGEEIVANTSGKAVELVQARLDMQTFIYMSNMSKAMHRCGEVWLSMAREVYVEDGRKMKAIGTQGQVSTVELGGTTVDPDTDETISKNDLTRAKFDVSVTVGPSSTSKKAAAVRALTGLMSITTDPETLQVLGSMAIMNMEGEGIQDVKDWSRQRLLKMGAVKPTEEEEAELAELQQQMQEPTSEDKFLEAEAKKATAGADKAVADTEKSVADAAKSRAQTIEIIAGIDRDDQRQAIEVAEKVGQALADQRQSTPPFQVGE